MQNAMFKKWLGLNIRTSETDILPVELVQLNNYNPFLRPGKLLPDKGFSKKFEDSNTSMEVLGSFRRDDNGEVVYFSNHGTAFAYWEKSVGTRNTIGSSINMTGRRTINDRGAIRLSMGASGDSTPRWFSYITRDRFYDGAAFLESIDEYVLQYQAIHSPDVIAFSGTPTAYQVGLTGTSVTGAGGTLGDRHFYKLSFVYDGAQESALSGSYEEVSPLTNDEYITFEFKFNESMNERITAVNVYRATSPTALSEAEIDALNYYYYFTIYLTSTDPLPEAPSINFVDTASGFTFSPSTNFTDTGEALEELYDNRIDYVATDYIGMMFKHHIVFRNRMYVANIPSKILTTDPPTTIFGDENYPFKVVYSVEDEYDVLPDTQFVNLDDTITGLAKTRSSVVAFTQNDMFFVLENRILDTYKWRGCWSADSIAFDRDIIIWAHRNGVYLWNGLDAIDISSEFIKSEWDALTDAQIAASAGFLDLKNREYHILFPGDETCYVYNLEAGRWRKRDLDLNLVINDIEGKLIGTNGIYMMDLFDGYDYDGTAYDCNAKTGIFELDPNGKFDLLKCWIRHKTTNGGLEVDFIRDASVRRTLAFATQTTEKIQEKSLAGYASGNSFHSRNMQMDFKLSDPAEGDVVDAVALGFNVRKLL